MRYSSCMGSAPSRDFEGLRNRRHRAAALFKEGFSQADVARIVKATRQSVSRWHSLWQQGGKKALDGARRAGRKAKLSKSELAAVEKALVAGPRAAGYKTEIWTLPRIAKVIHATTGVEFHPGHVWRLLRALGWSRQKPTTRAVERDEAAVLRWVRATWPNLKKKPRE